MKILIISNMYPSEQKPYAGIFVKNQYEALLQNIGENDSVDIFAMQRTFTSSIGSILKYFKAFFQFIPHYFKKYDVLHLHFFYPLILLGYLYKMIYPKTKVVVTFHGSDITAHINGGLNQKIFKFFSKCIDVPIAVGEDLANGITNKLELKVKEIISAGVNQDVFKPLLLNKKYDFIFVGSFIKRKGLDLLLKAIAIIEDKRIRYCIVGSGELEQDVINVQKNNSITLLKNQSQQQLCELYNQSKYFIIPSRDEPFGLVATESMFCATPSIVSDVGGLKSQVRNNVNGFIIPELSSEAVANTILEAYNIREEEYNKMVEATLISNKEHSMRSIINRLIKIYRK